jgi:hypothetical protein
LQSIPWTGATLLQEGSPQPDAPIGIDIGEKRKLAAHTPFVSDQGCTRRKSLQLYSLTPCWHACKVDTLEGCSTVGPLPYVFQLLLEFHSQGQIGL